MKGLSVVPGSSKGHLWFWFCGCRRGPPDRLGERPDVSVTLHLKSWYAPALWLSFFCLLGSCQPWQWLIWDWGDIWGSFFGHPFMVTAFTPVFAFCTFYTSFLSADGQAAQEETSAPLGVGWTGATHMILGLPSPVAQSPLLRELHIFPATEMGGGVTLSRMELLDWRENKDGVSHLKVSTVGLSSIMFHA